MEMMPEGGTRESVMLEREYLSEGMAGSYPKGSSTGRARVLG